MVDDFGRGSSTDEVEIGVVLLVDLVREGAIKMGVFDELLVIAACEDAKLLRPCEERGVLVAGVLVTDLSVADVLDACIELAATPGVAPTEESNR